MSIYKGFNTVARDFGPYYLKDNALIIRDLLNHFYIRKGEKLMNPDFGSIIWQSLFEPMTPALKEAIRVDVEKLIAYDPRIRELSRVAISEYENGLRLDIQITFTTTNEVANLILQFDRQSGTITAI